MTKQNIVHLEMKATTTSFIQLNVFLPSQQNIPLPYVNIQAHFSTQMIPRPLSTLSYLPLFPQEHK